MRPGIPNSKFRILNCLVAGAILITGCGRKGPPLPPFVRTPIAPGELSAARRGDSVDLKFVVPASNTDQTRPANIERIDIYALTHTARVTDLDVFTRGERIASVDVKAPRDPNRTIDPDEPASDLQPLVGTGLEQGASADIFEELNLVTPTAHAADEPNRPIDGRPLTGPSCEMPTRTYLAIGISTQGRRGQFSRQASVPLVTAPAALPQPSVKYDENGVTVAWQAAGAAPGASEPPAARLDSRPIGCSSPAVGYHVYEIAATPPQPETRLTDQPLGASPFVDSRMTWGAERCYTVRAVHSIGALSVESGPAPPVCEKLTDTFPPAAPKGLVAVASEGAINLIWDASADKDLAGYLVLRAPASTRQFSPVTQEPLHDTTFTDKVQPGVPFIYAVLAVDSNGNRSAPSGESPAESAR
jgi:predicted small lipoprotein YifL